MTNNASPRINETQKITKNNNDSLVNYATNKSATINILSAVDYSIKNKYYIRLNYYYQNRFYDRTIESKPASNYSTGNNSLRNRKIHTCYIDFIKKKDFDYAQFYYGAFLGGYYETPYQETSTYINYINKLQSNKRIVQREMSEKYAFQIGLTIAVYLRISKSIKIGMEIRDFLAYQIANQTEINTVSNYSGNNGFIDKSITESITNSKILYYNLFNPFFSIKYTLPNLKPKSKPVKPYNNYPQD